MGSYIDFSRSHTYTMKKLIFVFVFVKIVNSWSIFSSKEDSSTFLRHTRETQDEKQRRLHVIEAIRGMKNKKPAENDESLLETNNGKALKLQITNVKSWRKFI